jgi:hypothetical protein
VRKGSVGLRVEARSGVGWRGNAASAEDTPRLPWPVAGASASDDNRTSSLSEFYYHSNEDVERYFI